MYIYIRINKCIYIHTYIYVYKYIYIYRYSCTCVQLFHHHEPNTYTMQGSDSYLGKQPRCGANPSYPASHHCCWLYMEVSWVMGDPQNGWELGVPIFLESSISHYISAIGGQWLQNSIIAGWFLNPLRSHANPFVGNNILELLEYRLIYGV